MSSIDIRDLFDIDEQESKSTYIKTSRQELCSHQVYLDEDIGEPKKYRDLINLLYTCSEDTEFNLFINTCGGNLSSAMAIIEAINNTNGTVLGPHTAAGSGKVTLWDKPGLYGVTLDAVAPSVDVVVSNPMPGDPLFADTLGRLTLTAGESFDTGSGGETIVGRFAEFTTNGSLVTTPSYVAVPTVARQFTEMLFHFRIEN